MRLSVTRSLCAALTSLLVEVVWADTTANDPLENGRRVFMADGCYYCHGTTGAGGGMAGPRLTPGPPSLAGIKAKLRNASGRMPVYSEKVLSNAEVADIAAYLQSIPQGTDAKDLPLLNR